MDCVRLDLLEVLADALSFGILLCCLLIGRGEGKKNPLSERRENLPTRNH